MSETTPRRNALEFRIISKWQLAPIYFFLLPGAFAILVAIASVALGRLRFLEIYGVYFSVLLLFSAISFLPNFGIAMSVTADAQQLVIRRWHRPTVTLKAGSILSLTPSRWRTGGFNLRHTAGVVPFPGQFTGFHELINTIKLHSPKADIQGC